jgi:hypothetical protein
MREERGDEVRLTGRRWGFLLAMLGEYIIEGDGESTGE